MTAHIRNTVGVKAVEVALDESRKHVVEVGGNNRGARVDDYLRGVGLAGTASPWCAAFVTFCLHKAGWKVGHAAGAAGDPWNMAYCPAWATEASQARFGLHLVPFAQARRGDVVLFDWGDDHIADHIELVRSKPVFGRLLTIGGNTQPEAGTGDQSGKSGGDGVFKRVRRAQDVMCVIRVAQ